MKGHWVRYTLLMAAIIISSCRSDEGTQSELLSASTLSPTTHPNLAPSATPDRLLPHSLYFLDGPSEQAQVWRLDPDGASRNQLTAEEAGVSGFDVCPQNGSLAYISGNQLFLQDGEGQNRVLVAAGGQRDTDTDMFIDQGNVGSPSFSPDCQILAYALDGVHLHQVGTGQDQQVLTNGGNLLGEPFVFAKENYYPGPWSPSGSRLLIIMAYVEGSTLAIMEPGKDQPFSRLWSDGATCCDYQWSPDGRSLLVANPDFGTQLPGMWRYDAETGLETSLVVTAPDRSRFVGWPLELADGDLLFFYSEEFSAEQGIPLAMTASDPDGISLVQVRPEEFHLRGALWSEDGSLAVILGRYGGEGNQLLLARTDGSPLEVLIDQAEQVGSLTWGP
jgi:Tol biopolymer transport system component